MKIVTIVCGIPGQTELSSVGRIAGQTDSPLTPTGEAEARALARVFVPHQAAHERFVAPPVSHLYVGDDLRCRRAGQIIAAHVLATEGRAVGITPDQRLREVHFGTLEGQPLPEGGFQALVSRQRFSPFDDPTSEKTSSRRIYKAFVDIVQATQAGATVGVITGPCLLVELLAWFSYDEIVVLLENSFSPTSAITARYEEHTEDLALHVARRLSYSFVPKWLYLGPNYRTSGPVHPDGTLDSYANE